MFKEVKRKVLFWKFVKVICDIDVYRDGVIKYKQAYKLRTYHTLVLVMESCARSNIDCHSCCWYRFKWLLVFSNVFTEGGNRAASQNAVLIIEAMYYTV
jgi:hypothetical protein